ncbi:hypothetical protein BWR59_23125 [Pseudomonas sp. Bc-h]|jgi:hypothetical protein|uniref:hypothetical protein n=1 Tax=Pseudomonas sp. Bc-h TaxID=1943632 RepID=UPI0009DB570F|nr:hypothetical protein [Pseudomonas sp. Bc-h]OQR27993.1 hypothetical protein BWR59_23125 [Pseudomonas sp. Bc-h]
MDILALKNSAIELRKTLEIYKEKEPAVLDLHDHLEQLIAAAERGEITTPVEPRDIPGSKIMDESNLRKYQDLSEAYSTFYIELIGVRGSESYKMMEDMIKEARSQK